MSKFHRLKQLVQYGWKHAGQISYEHLSKKKRISTFIDILSCYNKYGMWSNQYLKERFWDLDKDQRKIIGNKYRDTNRKRETWVKDFYENRAFYIKYGHIRYEKESLRAKRNAAYTKRYGAGKNLSVEYDVNISRQHYLEGTISIGDNVLLAKHVFIDYSGHLIIHDNVKLSDGVNIETHSHTGFTSTGSGAPKMESLEICDHVNLGAKSFVTESCHKIGRYAKIGAGSIIRGNVPPYAIMIGNPAKIIGFLYSPEEMKAFEEKNYLEECRTPVEKYAYYYEKYYKSRKNEIRSFVGHM